MTWSGRDLKGPEGRTTTVKKFKKSPIGCLMLRHIVMTKNDVRRGQKENTCQLGPKLTNEYKAPICKSFNYCHMRE